LVWVEAGGVSLGAVSLIQKDRQMKYEEIYQKLKKKYTDEEIAESMLIPADLTSEEEKQMAEEMKAIRLQRLREVTDQDQILADVMRLRFQMERYVNTGVFSFDKTFGKYLEEYIRIFNKSRKDIAEDLSIHYTKLSRVINDKEEPNIGMAYRLEKHSGYLINARLWWKLTIKKQEFIIAQDDTTRKEEQKKVSNALRA
jgi:plasmid maintenance system antidote protein VapI